MEIKVSSNQIEMLCNQIRERLAKSSYPYCESKDLQEEIDDVCCRLEDGKSLEEYWNNYIDGEERGIDYGYKTHYYVCDEAEKIVKDIMLVNQNLGHDEIKTIVEIISEIEKCRNAYGYAIDLCPKSENDEINHERIFLISQFKTECKESVYNVEKKLNKLLSSERIKSILYYQKIDDLSFACLKDAINRGGISEIFI